MIKYILICFILFLTACNKKKWQDPTPSSLVPVGAQLLCEIDIAGTMALPSITERLEYERLRKPTLQLVELKDLQKLYIYSGNNEGSTLFVALLKNKSDIKTILKNFKEKFKSDQEIITGTKRYKEHFIYSVRDKKQEIFLCQLGPKTCLCGPLDQITAAINSANTSEPPTKTKNDLCVKLDLLSIQGLPVTIKEIVDQLKFFENMKLHVTGGNKTEILLNTECASEENSKKTQIALDFFKAALIFKFGQHLQKEDVVIKRTKKRITAQLKLTPEAMKAIFSKKKDK